MVAFEDVGVPAKLPLAAHTLIKSVVSVHRELMSLGRRAARTAPQAGVNVSKNIGFWCPCTGGSRGDEGRTCNKEEDMRPLLI